jgi:hypothetical protein
MKLIETHCESVIKNNTCQSLLNETADFEPFDISEISFEMVKKHSYS